MPGGVRGSGGDPAAYSIAPGRAHLLGGASPLYTRQGEVLAGRQVSEDSEVSIARCWLKEAAGR